MRKGGKEGDKMYKEGKEGERGGGTERERGLKGRKTGEDGKVSLYPIISSVKKDYGFKVSR